MEWKNDSPNRSCCNEDIKTANIKDARSETSSPAEKLVSKKRPRLLANIANTQYEVVKEVLQKRFKCKFVEQEGECDIFWYDTGVTEEMLMRLRPYQRINHFPAMHCIHKKNSLSKNLNRMRKEFPKEYNFFPRTWLLPVEWLDFRNQFNEKKCKTFIIKPEALSQGKGIFLTRSPDSICPTEHYVAQRYIHKPYLIDGLKFDLRIYVLVYGSDPLRIYVHKEGLVRLATESYAPPIGSNLNNFYMHLTNYAINKNSENFVYNKDAQKADIGHKRNLDFLWRYIDERGGNSPKLRNKINEIIVKTLCAAQPQLANNYRACQPGDLRNDMCFEILGFDILIDHKLRPWLLEVNHTPSFSTDTPFDQRVKFELLADTLTLLKLNPLRRVKYLKQKEIEDYNKKIGKIKSSINKLSKEQREKIKNNKMERRDFYEMNNCGGYTRIYPDIEDSVKYEHFLEVAQKIWEEFYCGKKRYKNVTVDLSRSKVDLKQSRPPVLIHKNFNEKIRSTNLIPKKGEANIARLLEPRYLRKVPLEKKEVPESGLTEKAQSESLLPTIANLPFSKGEEIPCDAGTRKMRQERIEGIIQNFRYHIDSSTEFQRPELIEARPPSTRYVPYHIKQTGNLSALRSGLSDLNYIHLRRKIHVSGTGGFVIPKVLDFSSKEGLAPCPTSFLHRNVL